MKITELEYHHDMFVAQEHVIEKMIQGHQFAAVFSACNKSFAHVVAAIQYRKKRNISPYIPCLSALDTISKYAPPLFEHGAIESAIEFVKSTRILSQSDKKFADSLEAAREQEGIAYALWSHLEKNPGIFQHDICEKLGIAPQKVASIIEVWKKLGIVDRRLEGKGFRLFFHTRLNTELTGICPNCGVRGKGRKELFFRSAPCQKCGTEGHYFMDYTQQKISPKE